LLMHIFFDFCLFLLFFVSSLLESAEIFSSFLHYGLVDKIFLFERGEGIAFT